MSKPRKIKIIYRKLGREKVWGLAHPDGKIEIDESLRGKKKFEILTHEIFHILFPALDEDEIETKSIIFTNTMWSQDVVFADKSSDQKLQNGEK